MTPLKPGQLKRTKPLNRTTSQLKRIRLPKRAKKHASANRKADRERAAYLHHHTDCAICMFELVTYAPKIVVTGRHSWQRVRLASEVHHLCGRNAKAWKFIDGQWQNKYEVEANRLAVCDPCHRFITDNSITTAWLCWQAKKMADPTTADLAYLQKHKPTRYVNIQD